MRYMIITAVLISIVHANVVKVVFPDDENDGETKRHFDFENPGQIGDKMKSFLKTNSPKAHSNNATHWCSPDIYPGNAISNLIKKNSDVLELLEKDDIHIRKTPINTEPPMENICQTESEYIHPKAAKNKKGKFMFIVNRPAGFEEYIQLVKVTTCKAAGQECAQGQLLNSISTMCHQEYSDHKLVVLSETGDELVVDTFSFPSCCSCVIDSNLGIGVRSVASTVSASTNNLFC
eukprot:GFUD01011375.1.p1 GENE.GFUD01011375.1~~GFUD01011375.1.p1  ORF type:complete len:234 (-),score=46.06 GFUD01011375.1:310-1011(-)